MSHRSRFDPPPPWRRAPILGFGLGAVAGGFEAVKLGATLALSMSFGAAMVTGTVTVLVDALVGAALAVPVGLLVEVSTRRWRPPQRYAACTVGTAVLLGAWFLVPAAMQMHRQGRLPAAVAFALLPIGIAGVVWFNALYWFRREELGERRRMGWVGVSLLGGLVLAAGSAFALSHKRFGSDRAIATDPSVLLVSIDTLRRDHVSAYGDAPSRTPRFDALAKEGVLFTNAITPLPETAPAHAAIMTGRHPIRAGMRSNADTLARGYVTVAEVLSGEGYATGAFVSSIAVDSRTGLDQGFQIYDDDFFPWVRGFTEIRAARLGIRLIMRFGDPADWPFLLERPAPATIARAVAWVKRNRHRPFFAWVHLFEPHAPYEAHPGFTPPGVDARDIGGTGHDHRWILSHEKGFDYTPAVQKDLRALYAGEVSYADHELGVLVDQVRALLPADRPLIVVVTADHGEMLGEHGIMFNHHGIWDETIRIPLLVVPQGKRQLADLKGRVVSEQVRLMDIPATIVSLIGLDPMKQSEGGDMLDFAGGRRHKDFSSLLMGRRGASLSEGQLYGYRAGRADGKGSIKYIWDPGGGRESLFDLASDPHEQHDIAAEQPDAVRQLRARVRAEVGARVDEGGEIDAATEKALEALGYIQ